MSIRKDIIPPPDNIQTHYPSDKNQPRTITHWAETPTFKPPVPISNARITRRNANAHAYRQTGDPLTWFQYISFGFYSYDDCHDFAKDWIATQNNTLARNKLVWNEYSYLRMNSIELNDNIDTWITEIARPYLKTHDPDYILATELAYEEKMDEDLELHSGSREELPWTTVVSNSRTNISGRSKAPHFNLPPGENQPRFDTVHLNHIATPPRMERSTHKSQPPYYSPLFSDKDTTISAVNTNVHIYDDILMPDRAEENHKHTTRTTENNTKYLTTPDDKFQPAENNSLLPNYIPTPNKSNINKIPKQINNTHYERNQNKNAETTIPNNTQNYTTKPTTESDTHENDQTSRKIPNPYQRNTPSLNSQYTHQPSLTDEQLARVHINDGTQQLTLRWQAQYFDELEETADPQEWDLQAHDMLEDLFHIFFSELTLLPWANENHNSGQPAALRSIQTSDLRTFLSPRISRITHSKTYIFGIRISAKDNHLKNWLNHPDTKGKLRLHEMTVTISNSICSSGNIVVAGYILLKHPEITQKNFYLLSLRRQLPETTPYFDIANHRRAPDGSNIQHLVVKCGENHAAGLSEILAAHLNGKQTTAIYVAQLGIQSMTQEEKSDIFRAHTQHIASIQRIALHPKIVNVDRNRYEHGLDGNVEQERSSRDWANSLQDSHGNSLQCDIENGGKDRRAYLLVPLEKLPQAKLSLQNYFHALGQTSPLSPFPTQTQKQDRPREIYIPTPAVQANLLLIQQLTSAQIWQQAPATIRTQPTSTTHSNSSNNARSRHNATSGAPPFSSHTEPIKHSEWTKNNSTNKPHRNNSQQYPKPIPDICSTEIPPLRFDDATVGTVASTNTRNTESHNAQQKFDALEAKIRQHQTQFKQITDRFDTIEARLNLSQDQQLRTMAICHESSQQVLELREICSKSSNQTEQLQQSVSEIVASMKVLLQQHQTNQGQTETTIIPSTTQTDSIIINTANGQKRALDPSRSYGSQSSTDDHSKMSSDSQSIVQSPEKKKLQSTLLAQSLQTNDQESDTQYKQRVPDDTPDE